MTCDADDSNGKEMIRSFTTEYKKWMTSSEAACYLGISKSRLHNLVSLGSVPYYKFLRSNRYLRSELDELLLSQPKGVRHD
jgi:excisionase family DNA binding protein